MFVPGDLKKQPAQPDPERRQLLVVLRHGRIGLRPVQRGDRLVALPGEPAVRPRQHGAPRPVLAPGEERGVGFVEPDRAQPQPHRPAPFLPDIRRIGHGRNGPVLGGAAAPSDPSMDRISLPIRSRTRPQGPGAPDGCGGDAEFASGDRAQLPDDDVAVVPGHSEQVEQALQRVLAEVAPRPTATRGDGPGPSAARPRTA